MAETSYAVSRRLKRRPDGPIRFRTTFRNTIYDVMRSRGWVEVDDDADFDFMWAEREGVYADLDSLHLEPWQRVNHFRNGRNLCRKDLLSKNLKRVRRQFEKDGNAEMAARYDFAPMTFVLPGDYALFVEEFKKPAPGPGAPADVPGEPGGGGGGGGGALSADAALDAAPGAAAAAAGAPPEGQAGGGGTWIMKPVGRSQGKGIFLFTRLSQIQQWKSDYRWKPDNPAVESYVVQRYVANPYLVGGKKFDMRLYALVTSFAPLTVYVYRAGFCRFSASRFSNDAADVANNFVHLTNVAVQKGSADYNPDTGGKWELCRLKPFLAARHGAEAADRCFAGMQEIMLLSLQAVAGTMMSDRHCFELYGYDVLIERVARPISSPRPWRRPRTSPFLPPSSDNTPTRSRAAFFSPRLPPAATTSSPGSLR